MKQTLRDAFEVELERGISLYHQGRRTEAIKHLENAHVLGQRYVGPHIRSHWWMLRVEVKRASVSGVLGQLLRIVLGAVGSAIGIVPLGNTGSTRVSMFKSLPIESGLQKLRADE
jgi:hypothetical protein